MEGLLPSRQISKTAEILPFQFCIKIRLDVSFLYQNPWIMIGIKRALTASISLGIFLLSMHAYAEDRFLAKDFLKQPAASKSGYIQISLMTANFIANQNDPKQGKCIGDWYDSNRSGAEEYILEIMAKNQDVHPLSIIMFIAEKKCGSFSYKSN